MAYVETLGSANHRTMNNQSQQILEQHDFPQTHFSYLETEYDQAAAQLSEAENGETREEILLEVVSSTRGAYQQFERHRLEQTGVEPSEAEALSQLSFNDFAEATSKRRDWATVLAVE